MKIVTFKNSKHAPERVKREHLPCDVYVVDANTVSRARFVGRAGTKSRVERVKAGRAEGLASNGHKVEVTVTP